MHSADPTALATKYLEESRVALQNTNATIRIVGFIATDDKPSIAYANATRKTFISAGFEYELKKIKARFICALTIYWPNGKIVKSEGKIEGLISQKKKGKNGFGYDPIFIPLKNKLTFGQMSPSRKYKIDHRFKAFKKIKRFF